MANQMAWPHSFASPVV